MSAALSVPSVRPLAHPSRDAGRSRLRSLIERADLAALVRLYTPLRGSGRELRGRCPFHLDHSPSLMVNPARGVWQCFGCCGGGSSFDFLLRLGLPPKEAVRALARLASGKSVDLPAAPQAFEGSAARQLPRGFGGKDFPQTTRSRSGKRDPRYFARWSADLRVETLALPASMRADWNATHTEGFPAPCERAQLTRATSTARGRVSR